MVNEKKLDISVVIPFKDKAEMTLDCVNSFLTYGPVVNEIILVSNNSTHKELEQLKQGVKDIDYVRVLVYDHPFNYQKINNWAIKKATSGFVLMLNNDTELVASSRGLIEKMFSKASEKSVGIVGTILLYGDSRIIQHAGVFLMPEGLADHLYVGKKYTEALSKAKSEEFPYDIREDRKLTAVTGAVQLVDKQKFLKIGGFDEQFIICGGDVDLCLRMNQAGYQTWIVSGGFILHKESQSRKFTPIPFNDFYYSYLSYIKSYEPKVGDPYLPETTKSIKIYGA